MKNKYLVSLINYSGCIFDTEEFTNLKKARSWASGRNMTFDFGEWHKYTVSILRNGEPYMEYLTK